MPEELPPSGPLLLEDQPPVAVGEQLPDTPPAPASEQLQPPLEGLPANTPSANHVPQVFNGSEQYPAPQPQAVSITPERSQVATQERPASVLDRGYTELKQSVAETGNPLDRIPVRITPGSPEHDILRAHGLSEQEIAAGQLERGTLLAAGFVMNNRLGNGEKAYLSGPFPDPRDPSGATMLDYTHRTLLTHEEVQLAYQYQQQHPERYGLPPGVDRDELQKDALSFVMTAATEPSFNNSGAFQEHALPDSNSITSTFDYIHSHRIPQDMWAEAIRASGRDLVVGSPEDWQTVREYWSAQVDRYLEIHPDGGWAAPPGAKPPTPAQIRLAAESAVRAGFHAEHCADLYPTSVPWTAPGNNKVRDYRVKALSVRQVKLKGQASPDLRSGYVFSANPDAEVMGLTDTEPPGGHIERRANIGVVVGWMSFPEFPTPLSEMGGSRDQQYITVGEYATNLFPKDPTAREALHRQEESLSNPAGQEGLMIEAQQRLIQAAREWKSEQPQPPRPQGTVARLRHWATNRLPRRQAS